MRDIEAFLDNSQQMVSGTVHITLFPHHFQITGVESTHDLMSAKFGAYGEMNKGWTGEEVKGFTRIFGQQTRIWRQVNGAETALETEASHG